MSTSPALFELRDAADGRVRARVHALRHGTWPASPDDITIDPDLIRALAEAYDPATYEAPIVIGHPRHDDPAFGRVLAAEADERGLWLEVELLPELAELIREGRYRAVSVAFWPPDATGNPKSGTWYLRHLGVLGAKAPAVKGLERLALADDAGAVTVECTERRNGERKEDMTEQTVELAEKERQLAERERELAETARQLAEKERQIRLAGFAADVDAHIAAGRVLPAEKAEIVALMDALYEETVRLAEGERPALDVFRELLGRLPSRVPQGELAGGRRASPARPQAPAGYRLSERGETLWIRAKEIEAERGVDFATAAVLAERELGA